MTGKILSKLFRQKHYNLIDIDNERRKPIDLGDAFASSISALLLGLVLSFLCFCIEYIKNFKKMASFACKF